MANKTMNFKADLLPNTDLGYSLGSSNKRWNIYGTLTGNASSATKLGSSNLGSATKPIYLSAGTPTECNTYAGGTAITLNNSSKAASTASFYAPTTGGTSGYPLIGDGTTSAPIWHGGLVLSGTAASSYIAAFKGTTDATSSTEAAVTIAGGLAVNKKIYTNSEFYIGTDNVGKIYSGADYTLSGSATVITNDNLSTYFTVNNTDQTYPWGWDTTNNCWALNGTTQGIHNINNVVMAEWKALSNFALIIEATVNSEHNYDYFEILVNGTQKFTTKGGSGTNVYNVNGNVYLKSNDIVQFRFKKDGSGEGNPEYYHAILKRQSYSSVTAVQIVKNLLPTTSNTQNLGSSAYRWAKLYLGSQDTYGSSSKPIYWNNGVPTECSATIPTITLNGTATTSASFYAPTSAGTSGYFLKSNGANTAPTWTSIATTDTLVKQTAKSDNVNYKLLMGANSSPSSGTAYEAVYDTAITVNPSTDTITATNFAGTATKATKLNNTSKIGDTNKPVYFSADGVPIALSSTVGNATTPVYLSSGTITVGNTYAGGTAVTLNGTSKAASTASFYAPTSYGTAGYPLIGAGSNTAPTWYGGAVMSGTATGSYITAFKGTTDATSSTEASVTIAGGLAIAKKIYNNSEFYFGTDNVGKIYSGAEYTLSGSATTITPDNFATYFTENLVDNTYPWTYNTTENYWESSGTTQDIDNIASVVMAEWKALSKMALHIDYTIHSESQNADYLRIDVNGVNKFQKGGKNLSGRGTIYLNTNDIVRFILRKDSSVTATPAEYYRAVLSRQNYSSVAAVQIVRNFIPTNDNSQNLGASSYRWARLYLGSQDTYGSSSKPIYWSNGVPTECSATIPTIKLNGSDTTSANFYAPTSAGTVDTQALVSGGTNTAPKWINISPSISITAGTSSATPKVNITVLGQNGTAQSITTASTSVYGCTKLSSTASSTEEGLAATPKGVNTAITSIINGLDVAAVGGGTGEYISKIQETDGKISATKTTTTVSNTWTGGTTSGPTLSTTVNGVAGTAVAIPSASETASGIITTGDQTFTGQKKFGYMTLWAKNSSNTATRYVDIALQNGAGTKVGEVWYDIGDATNITWGRFSWRQYSPNSTANTSTTGKYEDYSLPAVTSGLTENKAYEIFTSKNYTTLDGRYVTLSTAQTITGTKTFTSPIYFSTGAGVTRAILAYDASNTGYGITYKEGNPDVMTFSASGNANNTTGGADLSINALGDGIVSVRGSFQAPSGNIWAGTNGNTTAERQVGVQSGAGQLYMWSHAATTGSRGLYSPAHGSGTARALVTIDTNNRVYFADSYNGTSTALAYSQAGLAASAITWLTCWNGYELRAISKAEMANAVDSAHKWVRLGGDTVTGQIQKASLGKSWFQGRDGALIRNTTTAYTNNWYNPIVSVKSINGTWDIGTYTTNNSLYFTYITDANYNSSTNTPVAQMEFRGSDNSIRASKVYGAVWNDYAEFRETKEEIEPGRCIREIGDDTLVLTTERLQKGCEIVSDTFGFAIGKTNKAKTPTAASGRVLAYPYENREEFKKHIGEPICSGPNGTVSIMTEEECRNYPWLIIGTISSVPDYEIWDAGVDGKTKIKVNGRVWIRIR